MKTKTANAWGCWWRHKNATDGKREHIMYDNGVPVLFRTRQTARDWIEKNYGYIRFRSDLRLEPHGWKMPVAIRVRVSVT